MGTWWFVLFASILRLPRTKNETRTATREEGSITGGIRCWWLRLVRDLGYKYAVGEDSA